MRGPMIPQLSPRFHLASENEMGMRIQPVIVRTVPVIVQGRSWQARDNNMSESIAKKHTHPTI